VKANYWAIWWFAFGLLFFILATVNLYRGEYSDAIAMSGVSLACNARSEVKILQQRIEKAEGTNEEN